MYGRRHPIENFIEWMIEGGCVFPLVVMPVLLLFLSTVSRVAMRVRRDNRRIEPAQVWLNLVPVFNLVWMPITIDRLADSIRRECEQRGLDRPGESYTRPAGLTWLVLCMFAMPAVVLTGDVRGPVVVFV